MFILLLLNYSISQENENTKSLIKQTGDSTYQLKNIFINSAKKEVRFPAKINMQEGLIEVFVCTPGGKIHESVLVADIVPYYLQVSLLLLGLNSSESDKYDKVISPVKGDEVEVWVNWAENTKTKKYRAEELIWNAARNKTMEKSNWIFVGSKIVNGQFMADHVKSLVTTYNDQYTIIDNPLATGSNDELYRANEKLLPPKSTEVEVIIRAIN